MEGKYLFICFSIVIIAVCMPQASGSTQAFFYPVDKICFPKNFAFGVATAAYQIEGAWNTSGKGESMWDRYTHQHPERVFDHQNGDVATDSYHQMKQDVSALKHLGVYFYRFSISWPRILPTGLSNEINEDGLRYYKELIDELLKNNITPLVTMYHWDLPQQLQDLGGWTNPMMAEYFSDYSTLLLATFGDKVKSWITFNEPYSFCREGYGGMDAPGDDSSGFEGYLCAHNVLRAHAKAYRAMQDMNRVRGWQLSMGITLDLAWMEPASEDPKDIEAAETARMFMFGWFAHPLLSKASAYPPIMRRRIDEISHRQGFPRSRLPVFTAEEKKDLHQAVDFIGLNHYTTYLAKHRSAKIQKTPSFDEDMGVILGQDPKWPMTNSTWLRIVPSGMKKTLVWLKQTYGRVPVIVTENGVSTGPGHQDLDRIQYIDSYLRALHDAMENHGCVVLGYTYWSLLDNFEWMRGFSERFGLFEVDYRSPEKTRTPRLSAEYYRQAATTRCLPSISAFYNTEYYTN